MIEIEYAAKILYGSFARSMQNSALPHTYLRVAKQLKFFEFADAITNLSCFSYDLCTSSYVAVITIISKGRPATGHSCSGTTTCRQRNIIYYTNESLQVWYLFGRSWEQKVVLHSEFSVSNAKNQSIPYRGPNTIWCRKEKREEGSGQLMQSCIHLSPIFFTGH